MLKSFRLTGVYVNFCSDGVPVNPFWYWVDFINETLLQFHF